MSRHRNVRSMNYEDEYDGYDDVYGHSVEENEFCVSPATASQFLYDRGANQNLSSFMDDEKIPEEDEANINSEEESNPLQDSSQFKKPQLSDVDEAKLNSCLEEIRNIVGESTPEHVMIEAILGASFDYHKALDMILNQKEIPKPQRQPRVRKDRGGRGVSTIAQAPDLTITPMIRTSEPAADEPTPVISTGVARMTFTTGTKTKSGFTPEKTGDTDNFNTGEVDSVKSDLQKRLAGNGDAAENEAPSKTLLSTPKKSALSLAEESGSVPSTPKSAVKPKRDPAEVKKQYEKRKNCGKEFLNLVVIGHVDAGKSTLMGHVLYQLGCVDSRVMHKYEKEAQKMGKASFAFAWVLDETDEERSRGVTMDVAQTRFETDSKIVTLLDAPGHKDFIPNMITGAAQADVGILVVNATKGEFETGFDAGGQTREHAMLVRSLGVSQIIVAVNKMDTVDWAEERYKEIRKKLGNFLKQAGFKDSDVDYVPCSGLSGENLTKNATQAGLKKWYSGPCLTKLIDGLRPPVRQYDQPFRMCITDVFKPMGSGISTCGTLQAGCVAAGDKVLVMPQLEVANIKAVSVDEAPAEFAFAGDNATITLTNIDMANLYVGSILCDPSAPIPVTSRIQARIVIFNIDLPITKGFPVVFHYQSLSEPAVIKKLVSQLNRSTGEVTRKKPRCLTRNSSAVIEIELDRPICIELYKDFKDLGRFMLRYSGSTIAAGLVTEILSTKPTKTE